MATVTDLEEAQIMFKLARKDNLGAKYDRTEHFKRFQNLDSAIKELSKTGWILIHSKPAFVGLSLDTGFKKEIIEFIETNMPEVRGMIY
jgi:hypothetical protein